MLPTQDQDKEEIIRLFLAALAGDITPEQFDGLASAILKRRFQLFSDPIITKILIIIEQTEADNPESADGWRALDVVTRLYKRTNLGTKDE